MGITPKKRQTLDAIFKLFFYNRTRVQPFMPQFRICVILNIIMKSGIKYFYSYINPSDPDWRFNSILH